MFRPPESLRLSNAGVVYALIVLVTVLSVASEFQGRTSYLDPTNVSNILDQTVLLGIIAITTTLVLISGNFDLSVGSVAALGAALCLSLLDDIGFWPAFVVSIAAGALVGLFNGIVVQYVGINAFIVTLGTMTAIRGVVLLVTDGRTVTAPDGPEREALRDLDGGAWITPNLYLLAAIALLAVAGWRFLTHTRAEVAGVSPSNGKPGVGSATSAPRWWRSRRVLVPLVAGAVLLAASPVAIYTLRLTQRTIVMLAMAALAAWVLRYTSIGRRLYATGGNPEAARLSGIAVNRYKVLAFVLNGAAASFVGVLYAARLGSINPTGMTGFELTALAAAILGGTSLFGGLGSVLKSLVGALILITLQNGFNILNLGANWQDLIEGVVLIIAAAMYTVSLRRQQTRKVVATDPTPSSPIRHSSSDDPPLVDRSSVTRGAESRPRVTDRLGGRGR